MNVQRYARRIRGEVTAALALPEPERRAALQRLAETAFATAYDDRARDDSNDELTMADVDAFVAGLDALAMTDDDSDPERVADWIARAADNYAIIASAPDGAEFQWLTRRDDRVRDMHVVADGQVRAAGEPFDIGGNPLMYPGQPVGPPEAWINCRCVLAPADVAAAAWPVAEAMRNALVPATDEPLLARTFTGEKRRQMADSGTAMPDGSFPIANVEDLKNAIQAIGRAKDPDAAKRHIRKRARALGAENLIPEGWTASSGPGDIDGLAEALRAAPVPRPANTHDGPGWLKNPRETQRLRNYWTKGEGAAKIRWGTPGDLTRCEKHLRKYVGPEWAWGTCNNLHHVVFGFFNPESKGRRGSADEAMMESVTAAFAAADELEDAMLPPMTLFEDPKLSAPTPMTLRAAGDFTEYVGHLASWGQCHVGMADQCVQAPKSAHAYAYFRTGEVETDAGFVPVGHITAGTGHADLGMNAADTVRHYDDTGTVVADVAVGEDEHGIWAHGIARPGISDEQLYALRAGAPSGDWRTIGGNLEMVGALIVNVPGFPIPRTQAASAAGRDVALVAAAIVTGDPGALHHVREIAVAVVDEQERRMIASAVEKAKRERAGAIVNRTRRSIAQRVVMRVGGDG